MEKEFIQAVTFRPQRQPQEDPVIPDILLSSTRPLVAPKGKIKRTPSREGEYIQGSPPGGTSRRHVTYDVFSSRLGHATGS